MGSSYTSKFDDILQQSRKNRQQIVDKLDKKYNKISKFDYESPL